MVEISEFISHKMNKLVIWTDLGVFHYTPCFLGLTKDPSNQHDGWLSYWIYINGCSHWFKKALLSYTRSKCNCSLFFELFLKPPSSSELKHCLWDLAETTPKLHVFFLFLLSLLRKNFSLPLSDLSCQLATLTTETPLSYPTSSSGAFDIISILLEDIPVYDILPLYPFSGFPSSTPFILHPPAYTALLLIPDDHFLYFTILPFIASSCLYSRDDGSPPCPRHNSFTKE